MKCACGEKAIHDSFCKKHFICYFESKVFRTIKKFNLLNNKDRIACAVSGGKDSLTALHLIKKFVEQEKLDCQIEAVAIDEGIPDYRDETIEDARKFCGLYGIKMHVYSFEGSFGRGLSGLLANNNKQGSPCTTCGVLRRTLLNKYCIGKYDKMVTGHNLDDEIQTLIMNMLFGKTDLIARMGPKSGVSEIKGFVQRVKPLYFCTEKEVCIYALLKGFRNKFAECPNAKKSFRAFIRDELNNLENSAELKRNIIKTIIRILPNLKDEAKKDAIYTCIVCKGPSASRVCKSCVMIKKCTLTL